ncbi:hypothetical protein ACFXTO_009269 [Malus domestica]
MLQLFGRYETQPIGQIVERIFGELNNTNHMLSNDLKDFVGTDQVDKIESNMRSSIGSEEVCIIGICGMPGVGKSTIAKALSQRIRNEFEGFSFISKVGEISKKQSLFHIQEQLCDHLLDRKVTTKDVNKVISERLCRKRVLIILDNVDELEQIEAVAGKDGKNFYNRFGKGSRIIVTTTDETLLTKYKPKLLYKVEKLTDKEALLLFCRKAFNEDCPINGYEKLSYEFVDQCDGLPLALEVLGSSLLERSVEEWSSTLASLKDHNYSGEERIIGTLKVSYYGLTHSEQKKMFLDVACFFNGEDVCRVKKIFESCGYYPGSNIKILREKNLVSIIGGKLWMHDLLQKMGREIVRGENEEKGKRSRLWLCTDALHVIKKYKGTDAVKGIFLSSPKEEKVHLKKDTFLNMDDLKLLKIHNVIFSGCVESLSDELRFLEWHEYPLKLLPSSFEPENLVELHLPGSKIEKLWEEFEKPLETLVILNLTDCEKLIETPDFGKVPNLEQLILKGCTCLSEVPDIINLRSLMTFILSGCSRLEKLPEIGEDMKQLRELHIDGTAIEVLPTSIKHLTGLTVLNLKDCKNLLSLPDIICTSLTSLQTLTISGCANLKELPENLGCLNCLLELDASGTDIKQLPASIKDLTRLSKLYLRYCKNLCSLPATICTSLTLLQNLNLSGCSSLDELPENLGSLECLQELYAGGTAISEVPESISQLSQLGELVLDDCSKLRSWPRLPFSIRWVRAHNCPLLEGAHSDKIMVWNSPAAGFSFIDRRSDKTKGQAYWLPPKYLLRESYQTYFEDAIHRSTMLEYSYRSNKIPAWLSRQSTESSVTIPLPRDVDGISKWMGLALCFVCVAAQKHDNLEDEPEFDEKSQSNLTRNFRIDLYTTEDPHERPQVLNYGDLDFTGPFIHWLYIPRTGLEECSNKRFIRALITPDSPEVKVKECGASQINSEHVNTFVSKMIKHNKNFCNGHQPEEEDENEDGMRSVPSTSGVQIQQELQKEETTSSTPIVGQLRRNVVSLLEKLFEGLRRGLPTIHDYGFIFSRREKLQWFSEQSTTSACTVNLILPPYLHNDEKWAGLSLYVVCSLPQGVQFGRIYYECHLYTPIEAVGVEALMHRLMLWSPLDNNVGSHRLLIVHIPRVRFPERLNRCRFIQALFGCRTPGVKVEMCGMRLVYDQDLKGLIQTITHCTTTTGRPVYYGTGDFTDTKKYNGISLGCTSLLMNFLEAAKSTEHSSVSEVCPRFMPLDFRPKADSAEESQQERKRTSACQDEATGSNWDFLRREIALSLGINYEFLQQEIVCSYGHANNISLDQSRLLDFDRDLIYNSCFPPNEIIDWFEGKSRDHSVKVSLPPNLCEDTNWRGLALCAYFSVLDHSTTDHENLDLDISHNLTCLLETDKGSLDSPHSYCTPKQEFKWLNRMGGFIWLSYIPRCWFSNQLNGGGHLEASIVSDCGSLGVHRCGLRLIYLKDEEGLKETIMHCMTSLSDINEGEEKQHQDCEVGSSSITGVDIVNPHLEKSEQPSDKKWIFDCYSIYNSCFPSSISLEWFGDQSNGSSVIIPLPPNLYSDTNWKGLALRSYFSVGENPTAELDNLNRDIPHHLICHLESERGTIEPLHDYCTTNEEFQWLYFGGFIWVAYIPRASFLDQLNGCSILKASIASDHEACNVHSCGLRLVNQHDQEEFEEALFHNMMLLSDKKGKNKQCAEGNSESSSRCSSYIMKPHLERLVKPSHRKWDILLCIKKSFLLNSLQL